MTTPRPDEPLSVARANAVYDLLVQHAGAHEHWRVHFVHSMTLGTREFRFQGALGFGGKLYNDHGILRVDCYAEDATPERRAMITELNTLLKESRRMKFHIEIDCDNDAFKSDAPGEVARILRDVTSKVLRGETSGRVRDENGNTVGTYTFTYET